MVKFKGYKKDIIYETVLSVFVLLFALICLIPVWHTIMASFSDPTVVREMKGLVLYPKNFTLRGYEIIFQNEDIFRGIANSLYYLVTGVILNMVLTTFGAYALSRKGFFWRSFLMKFVVVTMFFSGGMLPLYMVVNDLGMKNTVFAIIVPVAISQWNMIILKTAFEGVPESIFESARMDGASNFKILVKIAVPLIVPTFAIITLYYVIGHWNSWYTAMIYLSDRSKYPLQLIMREILILNDTSNINFGSIIQTDEMINVNTLVKYTTTVVAMLPLFILLPFVQRFFAKGVFIGSIKS